MQFYVKGQCDAEGFHDIKDDTGKVVTNTANLDDDQIKENIHQATGHGKETIVYELVMNRWDLVGNPLQKLCEGIKYFYNAWYDQGEVSIDYEIDAQLQSAEFTITDQETKAEEGDDYAGEFVGNFADPGVTVKWAGEIKVPDGALMKTVPLVRVNNTVFEANAKHIAAWILGYDNICA